MWGLLLFLSLRSKTAYTSSCLHRFPCACRSQLAARAGLAGHFCILCRCAPNRLYKFVLAQIPVRLPQPARRASRARWPFLYSLSPRSKPLCSFVLAQISVRGCRQFAARAGLAGRICILCRLAPNRFYDSATLEESAAALDAGLGAQAGLAA